MPYAVSKSKIGQKKNEQFQEDQPFQQLKELADINQNAQQQNPQLLRVLERVFKDKLTKKALADEWGATKASNWEKCMLTTNRKRGDREWIQLSREMRRADLRKIFQYFARKSGGAQLYHRPSCMEPLLVEGKLVIKPKEKSRSLGAPPCGQAVHGSNS